MDGLGHSNTSSNGRGIPKAITLGKMPIKSTHRTASNSITKTTLFGSEITPPGDTPLNTSTSAPNDTVGTTSRLAWNHHPSYPVPHDQRRRTDRTSHHRPLLTWSTTQCLAHHAFLKHHHLIDICTALSKCHTMDLSISPTFHLPSPPVRSRFLTPRPQQCPLCPLAQPRTPSMPMQTSTQPYSATSPTVSSRPSLIGKLTWRSNTSGSRIKSVVFKNAFSNMRRLSSALQRDTPSTTVEFPTSASLAAMGSHTQLSGSNSTTTVQYPVTLTRTGPVPSPTSSTSTLRP